MITSACRNWIWTLPHHTTVYYTISIATPRRNNRHLYLEGVAVFPVEEAET